MRTQLKTAMTGNGKYWVVLRKLALGSTPYYQVEAHNQALDNVDPTESMTFSTLEGAEAFFERVVEVNKAAVRFIKSTRTGNGKYVVNLTLKGSEYTVELREAGINGETIRRVHTPYIAKARLVVEGMLEANEAPKPKLLKSELTPNKQLNVQMYCLNGRYTVSSSSTEGLCVQMRHFDTIGEADNFWRRLMRYNGPAPKAEPKPEPLLARIDSLEKRVKELEARLCGSVVYIESCCGKSTDSWVKKLF